MKKMFKRLLYGLIVIMAAWLILTLWAEAKGKAKQWHIGNPSSTKKVLIIYDPDPFYNLDQQVCQAFAEGLTASDSMDITISTVAAAGNITNQEFSIYVFCANTYNWRPDWAVSRFVKNHRQLKGKPVVAITLGSGSTRASQKALERMIRNKEANLIGSRSFWLLRPNDETRKEKNVKVAVSMVKEWAKQIAHEEK